MRVAIIGGGLAGLSCAHEFEALGITPEVFERNGFIGDQINHIGVLLEVHQRPIKNAVEYIHKNFGIKIRPVNTINNLTHFSPNKTTVLKGNFGHFTKRGSEKDAIYLQIASQLKNTKINLNTFGDYDILSKEYDYVVIANGMSNFTKELGCWNNWISTYVKGAVVLGNFDPNTILMWINKEYCKNGYAYLTPFNNKKASLVLVVTDVDHNEIDHYWDLFKSYENINYTVVEEFKLLHNTGFVYPLNVGNIYFAGNAGGSIDPFLGFGQLNSITMGVMAARSIVKGYNYEKLVKNVLLSNKNLYLLRKQFNGLNNNLYDLIISSIGLPGLKHVIYNTKFNVIKNGSALIKLVEKLHPNNK